MDKRTPSKSDHSKRYREAVWDFLRAYELVDFWHEQNPKMCRYTFHRKKQSTRIDYWLISDFIMNAVKGCRIEVGFLSDHSMVTLKLNEGNKARGPGLWKFNNLLLQDKEYAHLIRDLIENLRKEEMDLDPQARWDYTKFLIRDETIKFSKRKVKEDKAQENVLSERLEELEKKRKMRIHS